MTPENGDATLCHVPSPYPLLHLQASETKTRAESDQNGQVLLQTAIGVRDIKTEDASPGTMNTTFDRVHREVRGQPPRRKAHHRHHQLMAITYGELAPGSDYQIRVAVVNRVGQVQVDKMKGVADWTHPWSLQPSLSPRRSHAKKCTLGCAERLQSTLRPLRLEHEYVTTLVCLDDRNTERAVEPFLNQSALPVPV